MTPVSAFAGRTVALFGLGGSGLATALALQAGGARVVACDDNAARMDEARTKGIATADLRDADWSRFSAFVLSPGVPLTHPEPHWSARLAKKAGVEIIGDIELFCREREKVAPDAPFVAITGTNGKSTTTALIAHVLRAAGRDVQLGGNIGTAVLSLEPPARIAITSSSARRSRSILHPRSRRRSASCSTSRRIISTGTGPWKAMRRSRSASSGRRSAPSSASTTRGPARLRSAWGSGPLSQVSCCKSRPA